MSEFSPNELVMVVEDSSFKFLDLKFDQGAPYAGCRLCGAVFQTEYDRLANDLFLSGDDHWQLVYAHATSLRTEWREAHATKNHQQSEVELLHKTGLAFMPDAAHKLAPYGIFPMGNLHQDVVDALAEAPRAPLEDAEGSE